ncbi:Molybdopterin biosynthesis enzyme [Corynebacterium glyciniphilum AJ 3170]|uniref:Molybdopterin molybdenumtransferase n=1 Tax=Corynebacterium glyciniphilum AJ 3170 TaxID=1404245 RepID=X5E957_9CORY|nr:molybdopterin molybdotransferase MoeA [Corynebacterium glyciniphilum]AHW63196.1 Molybdopterin biosynthesis enzyme [Corynebacterium glyciniphilum AJ 3170]
MACTPEDHLAAVRALLGELPVEHATPADAVGRRLVQDVTAVEDSPRFDNSQMDGYALGDAHLAGGTFPVGPTIPAGADPREILAGLAGPAAGVDDRVIPVMTGARLPANTAAVVPVETCEPSEFLNSGNSEPATVTVPAAPAGQFVRTRGSDIRAGAVLLPAGHRVNPRTVGVAAAQGITGLPVRRRARIVVCTGGDEIGSAGDIPGAASIRDANGPMLEALCTAHGITVAGTVRTSDNPDAFRASLADAVDRARPDAVVTSGGISHGRFEVVRQVLQSGAGVETGWFGHVAQQPGGPQGLARFHGVPVVCLPGNPVSTAVSFRLFAAPVLGEVDATVTGRLTAPVQGLAGRDCFLRARTEVGVDDGAHGAVVTVTPVGGTGSHLLAQSAEADCLARIPAGEDLDRGAVVTVYPL